MKETYQEFIENILNTIGRFACGDEYHERHHIVPKCIGGGNEEENLIDLFAREHYEVHRMLAEENPENDSLVYAWTCMAFLKNKYQHMRKLTPNEYEDARKALAKKMSDRVVSEETRKKMSKAVSGNKNPMYGRTGNKNPMYGVRMYGEDNPNYGNHKIAGENNYFYGKHHTEEVKEKIRQMRLGSKASEETRRKLSEARKGFRNAKANAVYCIELDELFWGQQGAVEKYGFNRCCIGDCCRGKQQSAGKHPDTNEPLHWLYVYDDISRDGNVLQGAITLGYITQQQVDEYFNELYEKENE